MPATVAPVIVSPVTVSPATVSPAELDMWIQGTAQAKGIKPAVLVRDLLELGRGLYEQADRPVSMADVLRALASVRSRDAA